MGISRPIWLARHSPLTVPSCRPAADSRPAATRPVAYSGFLYGRITA
jgi:hypothetical protein